MHIPKFWAHSEENSSGPVSPPTSLRCWQWSDTSLDDARRKANQRGMQLAAKLRSGTPLDRYGYGDQPMREQIVESIDAGDGPSAVITRNLYGALVLNAARAMFIDIDFPPAAAGGLLGRWFKKPPADHPQDTALKQLRHWAQSRPELGLRVYRTNAGLRCLVINKLFEPGDAASLALLREAGSDPLYVRLCQAQRCFRARLTPKPWRCKIRQPPPRYPRSTDKEESRFRQWLSNYERAIQPRSVCRLIDQIGPNETLPEIAPLVSLHDQYTCGDPGRALA